MQYFGGAFFNDGGVVTFNAGSTFEDNFAESSGDGGVGGGIFNRWGGIVTCARVATCIALSRRVAQNRRT